MKNWKVFSALALLAGATAVTPAHAALNLVTNGSFETGDFTGWTRTGTTAGYPAAVINTNSATAYPTGAFGEAVPANNAPTNSPDAVGVHEAYFVDDFANNETLHQLVHLTAGIYQIGFSAYLPQNGYNNAGEATFVGNIAGVELANFAASTGTAKVWQTFSGTKTIAADGDYSIDFTFNTNQAPSKDVVIDQVYIIPENPQIPEPASIALLGVGLLGLGFIRRRHA